MINATFARHKISPKDYGKRFLRLRRVRGSVETSRRRDTFLVAQTEIDKDCMFSNDYEDECATICKICTRHLNFGNLGAHLHQSHGVKMKDYQEKFGEPEITRKSYHECGICHETLLFIRYHLTMHVKNKHGLTIGEYNNKHMQLHNVEYNGTSLQFDKGRKIGTQKAPDWCDGTMYKCPYCFNVYYRYFTFRIHLINSHKVNDAEERSACVRENEILTDVYRCKVCRIQVKRDRMDIEAHLKQAHKTTLKLYTANFERGQVFGEGPGCTSLADTIVRLVKEGQMEEPSEKMFKTPRKVQSSLGKSSSKNAGNVKLRLPKPEAVVPKKKEPAANVKQEAVEVKTEAFEVSGISIGDVKEDGFVNCSHSDYATKHLDTLKRHIQSLHTHREVQVEERTITPDPNPDLVNDQVSPNDLEPGKRKRKVPAKFLSSDELNGSPAKVKKSPPTSANLTSNGTQSSPRKLPGTKRKSPNGSSKSTSLELSAKAKQLRIASPMKSFNSPSFIPTNNMLPPEHLLMKPPTPPDSPPDGNLATDVNNGQLKIILPPLVAEHLPQKSSQFKNNPNDSTSKSLHLAPR